MPPSQRELLLANLRNKWETLRPVLTERTRRLWAATEARAIGVGGIGLLHHATGLSRTTIGNALQNLRHDPTDPRVAPDLPPGRVRQPGAGRKKLTEHYPDLLSDLQSLVDSGTRGDPESALRWTCKSLHKLKTELSVKGYPLSHQSVSILLHRLGYSLQANRKITEGNTHPDRDAQFAYINERTEAMQQEGQPVISIDCKKKELVGDFKNGGREWCPHGEPESVRVHDFLDKELGKAIPYGVFDVANNRGWVSVGVDHDTAEFAVATIGRWWQQVGQSMYPHASTLQIMGDGGGSNSSRSRLFKVALQLCSR